MSLIFSHVIEKNFFPLSSLTLFHDMYKNMSNDEIDHLVQIFRKFETDNNISKVNDSK